MKALKITGVVLLSVLVLLFVLFTLVLPNVLNLNNYKNDLYKVVKEASGLDLTVGDLRIAPSYNFKLSVIANDIKVDYPDDKNLAKLKGFRVDVSLLPLITKTLQLDKVVLASPELNLSYNKKGVYDIQTYIESLPKTEQTPMPIKLSDTMPKVLISDYKISILDKSQNKNYIASGSDFDVKELILNKRVKLEGVGTLDYGEQEKINFDVKLTSFLPKMDLEAQTATVSQPKKAVAPQAQMVFNPLKSLSDFDIGTDIKVDLKVSEHNDEVNLKGLVTLDKITYKITKQKVKDSFVHLDFAKNNIDIKSMLQLGSNESAKIDGFFKSGKHPKIDLNVNSKRIGAQNIKDFGIALLAIANVPNELQNVTVKGYIEPNFNIKSNMKAIESSGKLLVKDVAVSHKSLPLTINRINSNLDFSNNSVKIKDTAAYVNGSKLTVSGSVSSDALIDVKFIADDISIASLLQAFAPVEVRKGYDFKSGKLNVEAYLKGRLDKLVPNVDVLLTGLAVKDKVNNFDVSVPKVVLNIKADKKDIDAKASVSNLLVKMPGFNTNIRAANPTIKFNSKDLTIIPSDIMINSSRLNISGVVKDYAAKMDANVVMKGQLRTSDLMNFVPKEAKSMVSASGSLPMIVYVTSDGVRTDLKAQIAANSSNYITPLDLKEHLGKVSILNADIKMLGDELVINDLRLLSKGAGYVMGDDMNVNLRGALPTLMVSGRVLDFSSVNPKFSNIKLATYDKVSASIPGFKNSYVALKSNLQVNGSAISPRISGDLAIPAVSVPDFSLKGQDIMLKFHDDLIHARVGTMSVKSSVFSVDAIAQSKFTNKLIINSLNFNSSNLNLDEMMAAFAPPQASKGAASAPAPIPAEILSGTLNIDNFKTGGFAAQNIKSNLTLHNSVAKLTNMTAQAYAGTVVGNINYNVLKEAMGINMSGKQLDAAPVIKALSGLKDVARGKMDFNAKISMSGSNQTQQMKSLAGECSFIINNGKVGAIASLETFLNAQNLISQKFVKPVLAQTLRIVTSKETGSFSYLKGDLTFKNGYANMSPILMSGADMSFYLTGTLNLLNNYGSLEFLGKLSPEIVSLLGPIGDLSVQGLLNNVPKFGSTISALINGYNAETTKSALNKIPKLSTGAVSGTKSFKVDINGNLMNPTSVKSFKWLSTQEEIKSSQNQIFKMLFPSAPTSQGGSVSPVIQVPVPKSLEKPLNILKEFAPKSTATDGTAAPTTSGQSIPIKIPVKIPDFMKNLQGQ